MQKKALEAHGGLYNSDPATSVSAGPFILKEWRKGDRLDLRGQPEVQGHQQAVHPEDHQSSAPRPSTDFASYQASEIDFVPASNLSPADNEIIAADPQLQKETHPQLRRLPHRLPVLRRPEPAVQQPQGPPGVQPPD